VLKKTEPEEVGMSSEKLENLTDNFQQYVNNSELPGAVILVARRGQIAYFNSFGKSDMEKNTPMEKNSIFRIASQTKAIVSVGIMMLQEEGKLLITDPLGKYIPEFNETTVAEAKEDGGYEIVKAKRTITIRDLLTQDRKSTRLNSSHVKISYAVFCLKKKKKKTTANWPSAPTGGEDPTQNRTRSSPGL